MPLHSRALPPIDALTLLKEEHRHVEELFDDFDSAGSDKRSQLAIARNICQALTLHDQLETRVFYPAVKQAVAVAREEVNEGIVEHEAVRRLLREIPRLGASDEFFLSRMTVLRQFVRHHVHDEEHRLFPLVAEGRIDLAALGEELRRVRTLRRRTAAELLGSAPEPARPRSTRRGMVAF